MNRNINITILLALVLFSCKSENKTIEEDSQNGNGVVEQKATWDRSYGGADKAYDIELLRLRDRIAPEFQTRKFKDAETGKTMSYNLFVPKDYDPQKSYPLVLFMADASTTGKGSEAPLKQGYGGIIWATEESQTKNPSFVLVPAYVGPEHTVNDNWEVTDEVEMTLRLLNYIVLEYNVDRNRLYTTGQSMGGMMSFYFNAKHPDLFAASIFVGSQWDINVLEPLSKMKFFYIVSEGDSKASAGMKQVGEMLQNKGVEFGNIKFAADLPANEKEKLIQELINKAHDINFVQFIKGTVTPEGTQGGGAEHMYSFDYAYQLEGVRDWLFKQKKE